MTAACPDAPPSGESPVKTVDQFPRAVREIENQWIELADGARLAARIWLPEDALTRKVPAILEYIPYRKRDGTVVRDALTHPYFAGHGYACLRVDMRGNGRSDGVMLDEYALQAGGCPGCHRLGRCPALVHRKCRHDGDLLGRLQRAAGRGAPTARAQGHHHALLDRRPLQRRHPFQGGCVINEISAGAAPCLLFLASARSAAGWRPLARHVLERLEAEPFLAAEWLRHPHRDAYWKHGSVAEDFSAIEAAVLAVAAGTMPIPTPCHGCSPVFAARSRQSSALGPTPIRISPFRDRRSVSSGGAALVGLLAEGRAHRRAPRSGCPLYVLDSIKPDNLPMTWPGRWREDSFRPGPGIEHHVLHLTAEGLRTARRRPRASS